MPNKRKTQFHCQHLQEDRLFCLSSNTGEVSKQCYRSKKCWFIGGIFQISRCWVPRLFLFRTKSSIIPKNYGEDQQRLQISDLHFDKFPTPATFVCWKIRFKTQACSCSQFPTEAMQWIKEVEMVESVDDPKSSCSITTTSPSVRRSSMRAEGESITLKEKACRLVCRRQWVMIERWHPVFAVTKVTRKVTKFREKTLNANRLGLILDRQSE